MQVQTLLEDLKMAAQGGSEQFLGTFTFAHQVRWGLFGLFPPS